jgi:hypothetical protein
MALRMQRKQLPKRNFDPLVMLPPELAEMVITYLDMHTRMSVVHTDNNRKD